MTLALGRIQKADHLQLDSPGDGSERQAGRSSRGKNLPGAVQLAVAEVPPSPSPSAPRLPVGTPWESRVDPRFILERPDSEVRVPSPRPQSLAPP